MQELASKYTSPPCAINVRLSSCRANVVATPTLGNFQIAPLANSVQIGPGNTMRYNTGITNSRWRPQLGENDHQSIQLISHQSMLRLGQPENTNYSTWTHSVRTSMSVRKARSVLWSFITIYRLSALIVLSAAIVKWYKIVTVTMSVTGAWWCSY